MSVYLITARDVGRVKIGYTNAAPRSRYLWLRAGSPVELTLEAVLNGGQELEGELHSRFSKHRWRGEWFAIVPEIEELIAANKCAHEAAPPRQAAPPASIEELFLGVGNMSALARHLSIPITTVAEWRRKNRIPAYRRAAVEAALAEIAA